MFNSLIDLTAPNYANKKSNLFQVKSEKSLKLVPPHLVTAVFPQAFICHVQRFAPRLRLAPSALTEGASTTLGKAAPKVSMRSMALRDRPLGATFSDQALLAAEERSPKVPPRDQALLAAEERSHCSYHFFYNFRL